MGREREQSRVERLFDLGVRLTEGLAAELRAIGLTGARAELIRELDRGGPRTQRELAASLRCTPRNVTTLVDGLERSGHLVRETPAGDRRARVIRLTAAGSSQAATMRTGHDGFARELFAGISDDDLAAYDRVTEILMDRISAG